VRHWKNRRTLLAAGATVAAAAVLALAGAQWRSRPADDGISVPTGAAIILITIDTLRADRVGVYGSTRGLTPNLDRLAAEGIRFDAATAQAPLTLPSHATMLTGVHPARHGARTNDGFRVDPGIPLLSEVLQDAGYATGAFIGAFPLARTTGLARGFDRYDDDFLHGEAAPVERRADDVVRPAAEWLEGRLGQRSGPERLFAWIHLFDPHTPYEAPPAEAAAHPDPYDAEIAYTDAAIGRFFERLRTLGLYDRSILVVVADHGESLGEHGERTHGVFLYDATIRVPLIVRLPGGRPAGTSVAAPVETTDLAPTLAELAGATLPGPLDGQTLVPLLHGHPGDPERPTYAESYYQHVLLGWSPLRAIRTSRWKFIEAPRPELYDLKNDPAELTNRLRERENLAHALRNLLPPSEPPGADEQTPPVSAATAEARDRLRSLGYLSGRTVRPAGEAIDPKDRVSVWSAIEEGLEWIDRDPKVSAAAFERALAEDPDNGLALKYLGDISYRASRHAEAAARYERAIATGFIHPDVFVNLAAVSERLERPDEARRALEAAVALEPGSADVWNQLGILRATAGDIGAAREAFSRALDLDPLRAEPYYNLALLDRGAGREALALTRLGQALDRNPAYPEAHYEIGSLHLSAGRVAEALTSYRAALHAAPDYPEALFSAAHAAVLLERPDEARGYYQRFIDVAPPKYARQVAAARQALARLPPSVSR
jgi:choline-sulfatase